MKKICLGFLGLVGVLVLLSFDDANKGITYLQKFIDTSATIKTLTYQMDYKERFDDEYKETSSLTKLRVDPLAVYIKQFKPKDGLEVLLVKGQNNNNAWINPAGFPWVTLSLNPYSNTMREDSHYTPYHAGFNHFASIVKHIITNKLDECDVQYGGLVDLDGQKSHLIELKSKNYALIDYVVKKGDDVKSIAAENFIVAYSIIENNSDIDDYEEDLDEGDVIKIPNAYAGNVRIWLDPNTFLPIKLEVLDPKGLFEVYEYKSVILNPVLTDADFSKENENYDF